MRNSDSIGKLLAISSSPLGPPGPELDPDLESLAGPLAAELVKLLSAKNGFYAFESALHVFPDRSNEREIGLREWNSDELWRAAYEGMADGCLFFAEDVFGGQFCIKHGQIYSFDPETAQLEHLSSSIEGWAEAVSSDFDTLTGYPLAHEWQVQNGPIPAGMRLIPKLLFVTGGEFSVDNLMLFDSVRGMKLRGEIAVQIKNLPDGTNIKFEIVD